MIKLAPLQAQDAEKLFPLVYQAGVTDWLLWDGPQSLDEYRQALAERAREVACGERHLFTIWQDGQPVGSIDIRPRNDFRADIGLWVGAPYHGKGIGSQAVQWITAYGFFYLGLQKIEAEVFVGNHASRRTFEKCGFELEGTSRLAVRKKGQLLDEWRLGITRHDYEHQPVAHLCRRQDWDAAQVDGGYRAASLETDGFIHFSRFDQVARVAQAFYRDVPDLVLLRVQPARLQHELRYEPSAHEADSGEFFPHLYGALNLDAVTDVTDFRL
ncbi:MAG: GNAT family N-acetyltransferase [Chloroflexota bacterium]